MRLGWLSMRSVRYAHRDDHLFTRSQVLTGLQPFYHLSSFAVVVAVQKGERPKKPSDAKSLGLSAALWGLVLRCWTKSPTARPAAQELLRYLENASRTWVPPPEYPIPDGLGGGGAPDSTSEDEQRPKTGVRACSLFVIVAGMLWALIFPFARTNRTPVA